MGTDPKTCWCGAKMKPAGHGAYPYECPRADTDPDAMVYIGCVDGHMCWTVDPADIPVPEPVKS